MCSLSAAPWTGAFDEVAIDSSSLDTRQLNNSASLWGSAGLRPNLRFPLDAVFGFWERARAREHTINPSGPKE